MSASLLTRYWLKIPTSTRTLMNQTISNTLPDWRLAAFAVQLSRVLAQTVQLPSAHARARMEHRNNE